MRVTVLVSLLAFSCACSLVTNLDDLSGGDASVDAGALIPPGCATLDASACVSALPAGWSYALFASGAPKCPPSYSEFALVADLALGVGACTCGCATNGAFDCSGTVSLSTGSTCSSKTETFDAGNQPTCVPTNWNDTHVLGAQPSTGGNPTCHANVTGNEAWTSSTNTLCVPSCAADYCVAASPFARCVFTTGTVACPAPFTVATATAGLASDVGVRCDSCSCTVEPAQCNVDGLAYSSNDCSGSPIIGSDGGIYSGQCLAFGGGSTINSVSYVPKIPPPTCAITDGGDGSVEFANPITLCCLP